MSEKNFLTLTGTIFGVIGLLHLLRLLAGWQIVLVGWDVPVWISAFGVLIAWYLSYTAFSLAGKTKRSRKR